MGFFPVSLIFIYKGENMDKYIIEIDKNTLGKQGQVVSITKVKVKCSECEQKEWWTNYFQHKNRKLGRPICISCKNRLGVTGMLGKHHTEEMKKQHSLNSMGENNHFFGKKHTEENKKAHSERMSGENHPFYNTKRPEHSKWMKENWESFATGGFLECSKYGHANFGKCVQLSRSKISDRLHKELIKIDNFKDEVKIDRYFCDEVLESKKLIIEVYGDKFHANPLLFDGNDRPHPFKTGLTSTDIWEYDNKRQNKLESLGYKMIIVWENDIINKGIKEIAKWIKKQI